MAEHISKSDSDIEAIINIIDGWSEKTITWDKIVESCATVIGTSPTRQTLSSNEDIKTAYDAKKKGIKVQGLRKPLPSNLKAAADRIYRLESIVGRLKHKNNILMSQFVTWQYNASNKGMNEQELNKPIPRIDRDRTDK